MRQENLEKFLQKDENRMAIRQVAPAFLYFSECFYTPAQMPQIIEKKERDNEVNNE